MPLTLADGFLLIYVMLSGTIQHGDKLCWTNDSADMAALQAAVQTNEAAKLPGLQQAYDEARTAHHSPHALLPECRRPTVPDDEPGAPTGHG